MPKLQSVLDKLIDDLEVHADPTDRAIAAGHLLDAVARAQPRLSAIRNGAVDEMRKTMSHAEIAAKLQVTRARAAQLAKAAKDARDAQD